MDKEDKHEIYLTFSSTGNVMIAMEDDEISFPCDDETKIKDLDLPFIADLISHAEKSVDKTLAAKYISAVSAHLEEVGVIAPSDEMLKIKDYIDENYASKITDDELADKFFVSKFYLIRKFHTHFGITPMKYHEKVRMEKAKVLLSTTDYPTKKIAELLGYNDEIYFSRVFKSVYGVTAASYRKYCKKQ